MECHGGLDPPSSFFSFLDNTFLSNALKKNPKFLLGFQILSLNLSLQIRQIVS